MADSRPAQPIPAPSTFAWPTPRRRLDSPAARSLAWILALAMAALLAGPQTAIGSLARLLLYGTVALIFLIWVHEGGHLVAGSLVGFEFVALIVGPLHINLDDGRITCELHDESLFSGAVIGLPTGTDRIVDRCIATIAGGPIANLLVSFLLLIALAFDAFGPALRSPLLGLCLFSFILAVANAIPVSNGPHRSDGGRIADLLGHGPRATRAAAQQTIASLARGGIRPRDWDENLIEQLLAPRDGTADEAFAHTFALYWAHDRGDAALAESFLERYADLRDQIPPALAPSVWAEAAFFYGSWHNPAVARGCLDEARAALAGAPPLPQARLRHTLALDLLRAEAAVLHAEGQTDTAHERCRVWLREIATVPTIAPGVRRATIAWIEALLEDSPEPDTADDNTNAAHTARHHQQVNLVHEEVRIGNRITNRQG